MVIGIHWQPEKLERKLFSHYARWCFSTVRYAEYVSIWWRHHVAWWRHQMETYSALLALCAGNSPVAGKFPAQRPVTRSFDVFFDLRLSKWLSKQWWDWWFETLSRPLWRHCNVWGYSANSGYIRDRRLLMCLWRCMGSVKLFSHLTLIYWNFNSFWRHAMETLSVLLALCEGNPPVTGGFLSQRASNRDFDAFFDVSLNK